MAHVFMQPHWNVVIDCALRMPVVEKTLNCESNAFANLAPPVDKLDVTRAFVGFTHNVDDVDTDGVDEVVDVLVVAIVTAMLVEIAGVLVDVDVDVEVVGIVLVVDTVDGNPLVLDAT